MGSITFYCAWCGEAETLSDLLIGKTNNTKGWLCRRCIAWALSAGAVEVK